MTVYVHRTGQHVTHADVSTAASVLARELHMSKYTVQSGSISNGVSWTVVMYYSAEDTAPAQTFSLGFSTRETYDALHTLAAGVRLAHEQPPVGSLAFGRDDRVELGFILRSRGQSHAGEVLANIRDALEAGQFVRVVVE